MQVSGWRGLETSQVPNARQDLGAKEVGQQLLRVLHYSLVLPLALITYYVLAGQN